MLNRITQKPYFLILVIVLLGFFVRLYKIGNPVADWHSWRQADTASVARIFVNEGVNMLEPRYYDISRIQTGAMNYAGLRLVEFPINNLAHAALAKAVTYCPEVRVTDQKFLKRVYYYFFPDNVDLTTLGTPCFDMAGRMVSVIASCLSIFLMFLIGRKLYNKNVGLWAAAIFAFMPYSIYFSRVILPEPMAVMFALIGVFGFIKFVDDENKWFLYLAGLGMAGSFLLKPFTIVYLLPFLYLVHKKYGKAFLKDGPLMIRLLIFANIALAPFFIWRVWINKYPIGIPHFEWAFNGDGIRFQPAFWYWMFGERFGKLILGVWALIPLYLGLTKEKKNYFTHFWLLGALCYIALIATANVRHDYYQIVVIPPIALAIAMGIDSVTTKFEKWFMAVVLLFAFFVSIFQVKEFYKINHPEILYAGKAVQRLVPENFMVIAPYNGDTAFLYQTGRIGWPVVDESLDEMIAKGAGYFVSVNFADPDVALVSKRGKILEKTDQYIIVDLLGKPDQ